MAFRASATVTVTHPHSFTTVVLTLAPAYSYPRHCELRVLNAVSLQHRSTLGTVMYKGACWQVLRGILTILPTRRASNAKSSAKLQYVISF